MSIGGIISAAITLYFTGGNFYAAAAAYTIAAGIEAIVLAPTNHVNGPKLADLTNQISSYGAIIPRLYGTMRFPGNIIWSTDKIPTDVTTNTGGGTSGGGTDTTNTTYASSFAIAYAGNVCDGYLRLWFDKTLAVDISAGASPAALVVSSSVASGIRFYPGDEDQLPDPFIEATDGIDNADAFRGTCYIFFENFQLGNFGNRIPQIDAEIVADATLGVVHRTTATLTIGSSENRGNSWHSARETYWWILDNFSTTALIHLYQTVDGGDLLDLGLRAMPTTNSGPNAVNSRAFPALHLWNFIEAHPGDEADPIDQEILVVDFRIIQDLENDESNDSDAITHIPLIQLTSGSDSFHSFDGGSNRIVCFDDDTLQVAFGLAHSPGFYYGQRVSIGRIAGGIAYVLPSGESIDQLFAAGGRVFLVTWESSTSLFRLRILDEDDGTLIEEHDGPTGSPGTGTDQADAIYSDGTRVWFWSGGDGNVYRWNPDGTFITLATGIQCTTMDNGGSSSTGLGGSAYIDDEFITLQTQGAVASGSGTTTFLQQIVHWHAATSNTVPVADIVADLCDERSVTSDVTEITDVTHGFLMTRQMSSADALKFLASVYAFDGIPDSDTLVFRKRGGDPVDTITIDELGAHDFGAQADDPLTADRTKEIDLPQYVSCNFTDPTNDYLQGSVVSRRLNTESQQVTTLDVTAIAMSPTQAVQLAERVRTTTLVERQHYKFKTTYRGKKYQPGDVILIAAKDLTYRVRINTITDQAGILEIAAVADDAEAYTSVATAAGPQSTATLIPAAVANLELMDIAPLRDQDAGPLVYAKMVPTILPGSIAPTRAITLIRTDDATSAREGTVSAKSMVGSTITALADYAGVNAFDESNSFIATLQGGATPASVTRERALAGKNAFLVGREIVVARDVAHVSGSQYLFSGLRRYLRGTEGATHSVGERVVALEVAGMVSLIGDAARVGASRTFAAVTAGRSIDTSTTKSITSRDVFRQCFAPRDLRATLGQDAVYGSWKRRTRLLEPDFFDAGLRSDETDSYLIETSATLSPWFTASTFSQSSELFAYDNLVRYYNQMRGEPASFYMRVTQFGAASIKGKPSVPLLVNGGTAPNPKNGIFISTTATNGTTTFGNSGAFACNVTTVGATHVSSNRAVFAGGTDAIQLSALAEQFFGFGIAIFEIRMKFKTSATGVLMAKTNSAFDSGSWRLVIADVGPFNGLLQFEFSDFTTNASPLLQSASSFGSFRDGVEHEVRVMQLSSTGNAWQMFVDGLAVAATDFRNTTGGSSAASVIQIGNDTNLPSSGFVGTIGDPSINIFPGI